MSAMKPVYALLFALFAATTAYAQQDRPVRFILPNAAGSGVDAITRAAQPAFVSGSQSNVQVTMSGKAVMADRHLPVGLQSASLLQN